MGLDSGEREEEGEEKQMLQGLGLNHILSQEEGKKRCTCLSLEFNFMWVIGSFN